MDTKVDKFIEHHGVKGQRWGIRNKRPPVKVSADSKKAKALLKKPRQSLTNNELKILNQRLNLEKNFNQLNPGRVRHGKAQAEFILGTIGVGVTAFNLFNSDFGKRARSIGLKFMKKPPVKVMRKPF